MQCCSTPLKGAVLAISKHKNTIACTGSFKRPLSAQKECSDLTVLACHVWPGYSMRDSVPGTRVHVQVSCDVRLRVFPVTLYRICPEKHDRNQIRQEWLAKLVTHLTTPVGTLYTRRMFRAAWRQTGQAANVFDRHPQCSKFLSCCFCSKSGAGDAHAGSGFATNGCDYDRVLGTLLRGLTSAQFSKNCV